MKYLIPAIVLACLIGCSTNSADQELSEARAVNPVSNGVMEADIHVTVGRLEKRIIRDEINCTGRIDVPPTDIISIHSRAPGYVTMLKVIPGDKVRKGDLVAIIENPEFITRQRELLEVKASLLLAEKEFSRQTTLREGGATTSKAFEEAESNLHMLNAKYSGMKSELIALGFNVEDLELHNIFQKSLNLHSPTGGAVESVGVNMGSMIHPDDLVVRIINFEHVHLELNVLSNDARRVEIGQKVRFSVPGESDTIQAEIVKLSPSVDGATGTLMAHCHFPHEQLPHIRPGFFVNAVIYAGERETTGLPLDALVKAGEHYHGYIVENDAYERINLKGVSINGDFVSFDVPDELRDATWVTGGAYYVE